MSTELFPFAPWESGTNENSIPANDNALRAEVIAMEALGFANSAPGASSHDIYVVGTPWGGFATDDVVIRVGTTWVGFKPFNGWYKMIAGSPYLYDGSGGWEAQSAGVSTQSFVIAISDETTNLTTGTAKVTFRMPYAFTLTAVRASVSTAQTAGSILTFDINEGGTTILSTKLTIDNSEKTSVTAATPPVISDSSLADDAEITIDIDTVGTAGAKGAKITLIGYPT